MDAPGGELSGQIDWKAVAHALADSLMEAQDPEAVLLGALVNCHELGYRTAEYHQAQRRGAQLTMQLMGDPK